MKAKIITSIYSDLYGSELGGRSNRKDHYRFSLLSLLKMSQADFVCYTSEREIEGLKSFFYDQYHIDKNKLKLSVFDLTNHYFLDLFKKHKNFELAKLSDRCIEIQYMKFIWLSMEDMSYDYYYWIDAGLSHCGLIPNKYLTTTAGVHNSQYYESSLFNDTFLNNLISKSGDRCIIVSKENSRNYWSGTVDPLHFNNYDSSRHIIGGFFGGKKELLNEIITLFKKYVHQVTEHDKRLYHEEDIMTLMYRNHPDLFVTLDFDIWWHEDERMGGTDMAEHTRLNKSFYKILEELNR